MTSRDCAVECQPDADGTIRLEDRSQSIIMAVPDVVIERWRLRYGGQHTVTAVREGALTGSRSLSKTHQRRIHPRVERVIRYLRDRGLDRRDTSLIRLAEIVQLSPSRLMHVFTESIGIPLRPYLLWLRVQRAIGALALGHTVTDAALIAGFSDGAHLTRTMRRTLGITPRELICRMTETRD